MDGNLDAWTDFNVAMAGASAALAGLIIVSVSVNLERILTTRSVPARARSSLCSLILALAASCLALMPGQQLWMYGAEIAAGATVVLLTVYAAARDIYKEGTSAGVVHLSKTVVLLVAPILFGVGAICLIAGSARGIYWVAAGSVAAIVVGIVLAWVALVEILR